ncbi:hypothetical protein PVAND_010262 [Polypedilum vanderplanki]|uniref:DNA repair endonuclease XPF n=1 Tax=Polypedilum vanderplanki TaxID=319348 RepID=A0A9J6CFU8_POLVA|nr:hypothetical protein PVAND_010262 [Polypedilum vanderplanki]
MEGNSIEEDSKVETNEQKEKNIEDDINVEEINFMEKILEKDASDELKCLDFERQMFLDCVFSDGLMICAKGVSYEKVIINLFKVYLNPANLILILNCDEYEENYLTKLLNSPLVRAASTNSNEREKIYLSGGIQFISTQVLVLDLLKNKIPTELITGIFVLRAHQVIESCQEAFALRLYRQKNKTGFIKAFTNSAEAFTFGYGHVEKVMRNLFVRELFLWPRFHAVIQRSLKTYEPVSVEFHVPLSSKLAQIQTNILDIMNFIVKELKRINPTVDLEEVTVENCVTKRFQKILQTQLDSIWHQLNAKTKLLITDLKILRSLMFSAIYSDSVTFYSTLKNYRGAEYAMHNSGWTLLDAAERIFKFSKERVFNNQDEFEPEPNAKWRAVSEILRIEIPADIKDVISDERNEFDKQKPIKILILCNDARTCYQLNQYLTQGAEKTLFWTALKNEVKVKKLSKSYKSFNIHESGIVKNPVEVNNPDFKHKPSTSGKAVRNEKISLKFNDTSRKRKHTNDETNESKTDDNNKVMVNDENEEEEEYIKDTYLLTMTQRIDGNESFSAADFDLTKAENVTFEVCDEYNEKNPSLNATAILSSMQKPTVFIQTFKSDRNRMSSLDQTLQDMSPDYIILYNINITAIRQIEIFEARHQRHVRRRLKVYVIMHAKTVEEQSFLTALRREKQAFELLIETKRTMVVPEYQDGKTDVEIEDQLDDEEEEDTRNAGGQEKALKKEKSKVIVDSREFRSELPCLIHKRGLDVIPAMITIGDYILTPDICVERKSISDLIGSLQSGRLYNQCFQMTRHYSMAILLIEFDQNKSFHLQGRYMLSRDSDTMNMEIVQKIQLLTIHFPKLRLVWSPSPYATAQLFEELKLNREEPNLEEIMQTGTDETMQELAVITDRYNTNIHDFLLKLPGITPKNIHQVMKKGKNLKNLLKMSDIDLVELLGNIKDARLLHNILHKAHEANKQDQKTIKGRKFLKK